MNWLNQSSSHLAEGPEACALLLIEHAGMPLETEGHDGWRPLPLAAFYGLEACTRALVKQGARTDVVTKSGTCPNSQHD
jgi:ankyrin repeat protein